MTGHGAEPYVPALSVPPEVAAQALQVAKDLDLQRRRFVFGCPAGASRTALKAWPVDSYADLVAHLHRRHGLPVLLTGIASEAPHLSAVAERCRAHGIETRTWIGDADRIGILLGLLQSARLYLGADTGPMHFAGALGVPVVACFGGGHWPRFLPLARPSFVATQELPCFGCILRQLHVLLDGGGVRAGGAAAVDPLGVVDDLATGGDLLLGQYLRNLDKHASLFT